MAPEQFAGDEVDARADVYALGCVLYTALTGEAPFPRGTVPATMLAHLHEPPPRPTGVAPGVPRGLRPRDRARARQGPGRPLSVRRATSAARRSRPPRGARSRSPSAASRAARPHPSAARGDGRSRGTNVLAAPPRRAANGHTPCGRGRTAPHAGRAAPRAAPSRSRTRRSRSATARAAAARPRVSPSWSSPRLAAGARRPPARSPAATASTPSTARRARRRRRGRAARRRFADAYGKEDSAKLGRLMTRDVERVVPGARQEGRAAVLAAYKRQFKDSDRAASSSLTSRRAAAPRAARPRATSRPTRATRT